MRGGRGMRVRTKSRKGEREEEREEKRGKCLGGKVKEEE